LITELYQMLLACRNCTKYE